MRQYYYRVSGCTAKTAGGADCVCWHDEGTGPEPTVREGYRALMWRDNPTVEKPPVPIVRAGRIVFGVSIEPVATVRVCGKTYAGKLCTEPMQPGELCQTERGLPCPIHQPQIDKDNAFDDGVKRALEAYNRTCGGDPDLNIMHVMCDLIKSGALRAIMQQWIEGQCS